MIPRPFVLVLVLGVLAGCGEPQRPSEDATYESSDVAHSEIKAVNAPYAMQTVAVVPFVNKSLSRYRELGDAAPDVLSGMLIDAGFRVVEGKDAQLDAVNRERDYGQTEFVDAKTAAQIGKHLGTKYVYLGAVTDYNEVRTKGKKEFDALGIVEIGGGEEAFVINCAVSSRLVDVETREILGADPATRKKQKYEVSGGKFKIFGIGTKESQMVDSQQETLGVVLKLAFADSLNKVITQINRRAAMMPAPAPAPAPARPPPG